MFDYQPIILIKIDHVFSPLYSNINNIEVVSYENG